MIVQITPPAIANIGWKTYIIFAVLNACWVPIIYLFFPETKGLELEAVDALFSGDAPVEPFVVEKGVGESVFQEEFARGEKREDTEAKH